MTGRRRSARRFGMDSSANRRTTIRKATTMLDVQQRGRLAVIKKIVEGAEAGFYDLPDEVRKAATWFPTFTDRLREIRQAMEDVCLLYTSDAADDLLGVDLG